MKRSRFHEIDVLPDESVDDFMDGRLKLIQSKAGYRFSIDAILLSEFVTIKKGDAVVDLGTGCGIVPLVLLLTRPVRYAVGLEIQGYLAGQSSRNAMINGFSGNMDVIRADIRQPPLRPGSADAVVCNPPYRKKESGRINPDQQRAIARHEIWASLEDILNAARHILRAKGRLAMIYPVERLVDLMWRMRQQGLEPKRMRIIYPGMGSEAKLAMIEATLGGRSGLKILPPLLEQGDYSIRYQA
jgi:tRNA1Val (adenine37-N6)-methyltransferase